MQGAEKLVSSTTETIWIWRCRAPILQFLVQWRRERGDEDCLGDLKLPNQMENVLLQVNVFFFLISFRIQQYVNESIWSSSLGSIAMMRKKMQRVSFVALDPCTENCMKPEDINRRVPLASAH